MHEPEPRTVALIGPGRAGTTITAALEATGWRVTGVAGRSPASPATRAAAARLDAPTGHAREVIAGAALVLIATPDAHVRSTAEEVATVVSPSTLVIHLAGALGLDVLGSLPCRIGALHPLQTFPSADLGLAHLSGSGAAVAGDDEVSDLARSIGLTPFAVDDADRAGYHAAACIASNHLVALLAQVESCTGVPLWSFLALVRATVDNVDTLGPAAALTGPVSRGDADTVVAHLAAIPRAERGAYTAMARRAAVLAGRDPDLGGVLA